MAPEWAAPRTIQHWPGTIGNANRNKVDTIVAYDPNSNVPMSWGFRIDKDRTDLDIQELFKLWLDPVYHDGSQSQPPLEEVQGWFSDYMIFLRGAIEEHMDMTYPRWREKKTEFLFSVPTTWKNPAMIANIEGIIKSAGFGAKLHHRAKISLTEAEAAAVCVAKEAGYQRGEVFLICDAGGGTTDVDILKVDSCLAGRTQLKQLGCVQGRAVGSTLIDFRIEQMVKERLRSVEDHLPESVNSLAEKMLRERFETFKCSFGSKAQIPLDLLLPIPGMRPGVILAQARIQNSSMVITAWVICDHIIVIC